MKGKFKTVNNWVCQQFMTSLVNGNYRSCCFIMYNFFEECLVPEVGARMTKFFFDYCPKDSFTCLGPVLPADVRFFIVKLYNIYYEKN